MDIETKHALKMLEYLPERVQNTYRNYVTSGQMKVACFKVFKKDIDAAQQALYQKNKDFYDALQQCYVLRRTPSRSGATAILLRSLIKEKYPGWCEVRTMPSSAFSSWWKKGNIYYMLIKRRYERI